LLQSRTKKTTAFTAASTIALDKWCKVPLTFSERVELIVVGTQVGRSRLDEALNALDENWKEMGASEFCLRLEKGLRGKVEWEIGGGMTRSFRRGGGERDAIEVRNKTGFSSAEPIGSDISDKAICL
jgi:hypothetical protein